jgi:hypothetical protein
MPPIFKGVSRDRQAEENLANRLGGGARSRISLQIGGVANSICYIEPLGHDMTHETLLSNISRSASPCRCSAELAHLYRQGRRASQRCLVKICGGMLEGMADVQVTD